MSYFTSVRPAVRPLLQTLLGTGIRLGEAEGLRVSDLRLGNGEARAMIEDGKTDEALRTVFIPGWVVEAQEAYMKKTGRSGRERLFQIPRRTVQQEHNNARKQIGRPEYTLHDHRHTAAVHLVRAGRSTSSSVSSGTAMSSRRCATLASTRSTATWGSTSSGSGRTWDCPLTQGTAQGTPLREGVGGGRA